MKVQIDLSPNKRSDNSGTNSPSVGSLHTGSRSIYYVDQSSDNDIYCRSADDLQPVVPQKSIKSKQRWKSTDLHTEERRHRHKMYPYASVPRRKTNDFGRPPSRITEENEDEYHSVLTDKYSNHCSASPEQFLPRSSDAYLQQQHITQDQGSTFRGTGMSSFQDSSYFSNIDSLTNVQNYTNRYPPASVYSGSNIQNLPSTVIPRPYETRLQCSGVVNPCFLPYLPPSEPTNQELLTAFRAELSGAHSESRKDSNLSQSKLSSKCDNSKHSKKRKQNKKLFILPVNTGEYQRIKHHSR